MLERIRYSMAKNFILGSMCKMGSPKYCLTEQQAQFMADVMGDPKRIKEAASLMKSGVSKHEALAHSFIICEHQTKQLLKETEKQALVPPTLWRKAARYALIDGGYNDGERTAKILELVAKCKTTEP